MKVLINTLKIPQKKYCLYRKNYLWHKNTDGTISTIDIFNYIQLLKKMIKVAKKYNKPLFILNYLLNV